MTTRWILAATLCAVIGTACDDGATTPTAPSPTTAAGGATTANGLPGTAQQLAGNQRQMTGGPTASATPSDGSQHATTRGPTPEAEAHKTKSLTDLDIPVRKSIALTRTDWLTANPEPVTVGSWTEVDNCSGANCWKHERAEPWRWYQASNCTTGAPSEDLACWERTPGNNDGQVTIRFNRSGHATTTSGRVGPWTGVYFPGGRSRSIEGGQTETLNNCGSESVGETPVECTTRIPADACEADQIHEEDIPGYGPWRHVLQAICRPAKVVLNTRVGEDPLQAYRNEVCIRTQAFFNGETITSEANCP